MYYGNDFGFYAIFHIIWVVIVVMAIVWLVRMAFGHDHRGRFHDRMNGRMGGGKTALEILKERYANGEIDKAEFDAKKSDLM